ncbi:hypothetical protein JCM19047_3244 [Bacillus sp. JCM 19047]|nr:hypothetical protein JCM19047_3244 [Bacillus sp. JCM 19047]
MLTEEGLDQGDLAVEPQHPLPYVKRGCPESQDEVAYGSVGHAFEFVFVSNGARSGE